MSKFITREALRGMIDRNDDFILVDMLSHESFEHEHIPGSINIPLENIEISAEMLLDKEKEIVVYCGNLKCTASVQAEKKLTNLGYMKVYDYAGGLQDWKDAHFPTVCNEHASVAV
jgi:rhodanese-related sulfurtransferase